MFFKLDPNNPDSGRITIRRLDRTEYQNAGFERLFGAGDSKERAASLGQRYASKKSVLDFGQQDALALQKYLGRSDPHKLNEYLTGVREIERQIEKAESMGLPKDPGVPAPDATPESYKEHLRLMMGMMVLAFKTDSTRISTFLMAHGGRTRSFPEIVHRMLDEFGVKEKRFGDSTGALRKI